MTQPVNDGLAHPVPTAGMTPLGAGADMYVPDTQPMVDLNVPIPSATEVTSEGHVIGGPGFLHA